MWASANTKLAIWKETKTIYEFLVTIKMSVHVQTQLTHCWSREGESTGQTRGKIVNEWFGFLSFGGMSIELSSVDTTDRIVSKSRFSSLLLFFSLSLLLFSSLFSLLTVAVAVMLSRRWLCMLDASCSEISLRGSLTSQPASLKGQSTISSGHSFLCSSISFLFTFSLHLLGHSKMTLGQVCMCLPTITECLPSSLQSLQCTIRLGHSCLQCCLRSFLSNPRVPQSLVHSTTPNGHSSTCFWKSPYLITALHPFLRFVQYTPSSLISLIIGWETILLKFSARQWGQIDSFFRMIHFSIQALQKCCPQHSVRTGVSRRLVQILHLYLSANSLTNTGSFKCHGGYFSILMQSCNSTHNI